MGSSLVEIYIYLDIGVVNNIVFPTYAVGILYVPKWKDYILKEIECFKSIRDNYLNGTLKTRAYLNNIERLNKIAKRLDEPSYYIEIVPIEKYMINKYGQVNTITRISKVIEMNLRSRFINDIGEVVETFTYVAARARFLDIKGRNIIYLSSNPKSNKNLLIPFTFTTCLKKLDEERYIKDRGWGRDIFNKMNIYFLERLLEKDYLYDYYSINLIVYYLCFHYSGKGKTIKDNLPLWLIKHFESYINERYDYLRYYRNITLPK
ncbi:hypothetical protein H6G33_10565 [Calothrix sp. FACHB-1219]|uniref:hypothetical protein n=1 Tax=unclassified Calothrix TaxID=2619626 RepID=UPI0016867C02|nr:MULTISPECIES: hypothetical protein [unclassified Calothrix]MBD2201790.1 hypothetical protein [Calothrix sp. FACHB-168]MBD2217476.1 hypothetical protein [Calothrix sp. FACHB-1219]